MKAKFNKLFTLLTILTLGISNVWAGVTIFSSVSQETTDGTWTITGSSNSASNQSNVVFPDPAAETGFPVGKVTASTAYYCKLSSSSDKGAKLATTKRITIGGLSAGDSIVVYWFATSTTSGKLCLSYATGASAGSYIEEVSLGTIVTKQLYATSFKALTATDIDHIENGYSGSAKLAYISSNGPSPYVYAVKIIAGSVTKHTVTYDLNGATGTTPTQADVAEGAKFTLHNGTTDITAPANKAFAGWYDGTSTYAGGAEYTMSTSNVTLTAQWADSYTVTYDVNGASSATPTETNKAGGAKFTLAAAPTYAGQRFMGWNDGTNTYAAEAEYTMPSDNVTLTAQWSALYAITEDGATVNGTVAAGVAEAIAGEEVTVDATPADGYMLDAWDVYKTGESSIKVSVAGGKFTMPAYPVTVSATFVADTRKKVLYVTATAEATVKANDKLYAALKDIYNVKIVGSNSDEDQTGYDLIVLHESVGGGDYNKTAVATAKAGNKPVLNTKSYFYNNANTTDQRWNWGTPNAGQSVKGATQNSAYCNIADHPLFAGVTVTDGFFEITDAAAAKCMQPVKTFTTGKEGYTLATTPNNDSGNGTAIHELTPAQRGASAGKYLLISVSNAKLDALNANGQKLFQNAAAYLIGSTSWEPISVPTAAEVTATPSENYTEGNTITLTASATGTSASTTYTWYKGADWATASATTPVQAAATAATDGNVFTKTAALGDEGTYWCNISNGTSCDVQASVTITVSSASTPTHAITYDNTKGADMTAYPTEYTEGIGVASFDDLADITGWHFVEWSPASIAADATTDQTITAVWAQVFEVTFDLQGHGATIDAQNIVDGGKVTKPADPVAIGWDFGGWFTDAECTAGNEWDFDNDVVSTATPLFAKWTAFAGCTLLYPATSGSALNVGDNVDLISGSYGGTISIVGMKTAGSSISYDARGLLMGGGAADIISVTLSSEMDVDTKITVTLDAKAGGRPRGLYLLNETGGSVKGGTLLGWPNDGSGDVTEGEGGSFSYTVEASDGLEGTNVFRLKRQNSTYIKSIKVESCGAALIFHNLTSAITPDHDPAYATVTLSASSVREGHTATAEYSAIDPAYEFDEWQISGTDASIADASANPAVITMGTADAVVTLKLKVATVKHTVSFNTHGGSAVASQEVEDGANPVAPADPTKDEYIFQGWAEAEDGAIVDVTSFAITADKEFHAVWVAEPAGIKLINGDGSINTVNFTTGVTASTVNFDDADHNCAVFGSTGGSIVGLTGLNKVVAYNATTTQTKVKFVLYNTNGSAKELYLQKVLEGATEAVTETIAVPSKERHETIYYTYNSSDLRSFYVTTNSTDVKILQMKVIEDGTVLPRAGETGYELNLNLGRVLGAQNTATTFEGLAFEPSSNAKVLNSTELQIKTPLSFSIAAPLTLTVTTNTAKYYVSQNSAEDGTTATAITAAGTETFDLTATGTWYIVPSTTSAVKLTNIAFSAPRPDRTITFDSDGGSAVADIVVKDGEVAVAPADPTKDDNDFAGWYLGADPYDWSAAVTADIELTAHWTAHVNNDATLSALSYGGNAITLSDGVYEYDVNLPALTLAVPALTAVPNAALATADVTDAADFDGAGQATSTVLVTAEDNTTQLTYTVNFTKAALLPQVDVTENTTWDWANIASENITLTDLKNHECVLANVEGVTNDATFNSQALLFYGERVRNVENTRTFATIGHISFNVTVAGTVRVEFSDNGTNNRRIKINEEQSDASSSKTDVKTFEADVTAGIVTIMGISEDGASTNQYVRISRIEFEVAAPTKDLVRDGLSNGKWGTLCPKQTVENVEGATFYQIAYLEEQAGLPYNMVWDAISGTTLEAGKPYFFIANATEIRGNKTGAELDAAGAAVNGFYGWISPTDEKKPLSWRVDYDPTGDNTFVIYNNEVLRLNADGTELRSERCYININATEPTRTGVAPMPGRDRIRMSIAGVSVVTGMEEITNDQSQMTNKVIIDGRLYILRGEKMYDATGRQVK